MKRLFDLGVSALVLGTLVPLGALWLAGSLLSGGGLGLRRVSYSVTDNLDLQTWQFSSERLRRWHLARIPELIHVITGDLSLVGPRPIDAEYPRQYGKALAFIESAKPGFIGPWWLVGVGRSVDAELELAYDLYYLRNYSIWLDIQVVVQAVRSLVSRVLGSRSVDHTLWGLERSRVGP